MHFLTKFCIKIFMAELFFFFTGNFIVPCNPLDKVHTLIRLTKFPPTYGNIKIKRKELEEEEEEKEGLGVDRRFYPRRRGRKGSVMDKACYISYLPFGVLWLKFF